MTPDELREKLLASDDEHLHRLAYLPDTALRRLIAAHDEVKRVRESILKTRMERHNEMADAMRKEGRNMPYLNENGEPTAG